MYHLIALLIGFFIDLLLGDPHSIPHPVVWIGKLISAAEKLVRRLFPKTVRGENIAGGVLWVIVVLVSTAVPALLLYAAYRLHPAAGLVLESIMCWQILATRSLRDESMKVYAALKKGVPEEYRRAVSMIVGRDTAELDDLAVTRAAVETVAENASDGVIAPMLFLALGGAPLGFFYKAANTMDSMLGYIEMPYKNIGLVPAKMDDVLNYIPARLSALLMLGTMPAPTPRRRSPCARACSACVSRAMRITTASSTKSRTSATRCARSNTRTSPARGGCSTRRRRSRSFCPARSVSFW